LRTRFVLPLRQGARLRLAAAQILAQALGKAIFAAGRWWRRMGAGHGKGSLPWEFFVRNPA
jgi:hypothetical protein